MELAYLIIVLNTPVITQTPYVEQCRELAQAVYRSGNYRDGIMQCYDTKTRTLEIVRKEH